MPSSILEELFLHLPQLKGKPLGLEPIEKGGSDRLFFRVEGTKPHPLILIRYGEGKEENRHYVALAQFLESIGLHVPRIVFHDPVKRLIGMEDLGERDLWSHRADPWAELRPLYEAALRQAVLLHANGHRSPDLINLPLQNEFDAALYRWEQRYFFDNCAKRVFGREWDPDACPGLDAIADKLAAMPRTLVHRDFQSQNVLICDGETHLIDFQGLRRGLPHYDVASLLFDPYVALEKTRRQELAASYEEEARKGGVPMGDDFEAALRACAVQRLMQALGAYGFLGIEKGRSRFLSHIPVALPLLRDVAGECPDLDPFSEFLCSLPDAVPELLPA
jgi:aminoglycoside/choline kinase family phosphotransferase